MNRTLPPRVLVFSHDPEHCVPTLQRRFPNVPIAFFTRYADLESVLSEFKPTVVLGCKFEKHPWPSEPFFAVQSLEWLSVTAAGNEHVTPWNEERCVVTNCSGIAAIDMAPYMLIGRDALSIDAISRDLVDHLGFAATGVETRAASAVDIGLWDILGTFTNQPIV